MTATHDAGLRRTLGFTDLLLLTLGTVIGSGIFIVPGVVLKQTQGHLGVALLVWIVGGVVSFLGALTYAELGAMTPEAGGLYAYIRDAFGPLPAFLYGWASFLVIASGSVATLAVAFSAYLGQLVPLSPVGAKAASTLMIVVIAAINVRGTRHSATVENSATSIKVGALLVIGIALAVAGHAWPAPASLWPPALTTSVMSGFGAAMIGVLWAYEGWQYVTFSAGETRDPQRVFPRSIAVATFALIVLYLLANVGYVAAIGPAAASQSGHVAADATAAVFGSFSGKLLSILALVSIFSATNGLTLTAPRLYFAMARDGLFFARLARVSERFATPASAIVLLSCWSIVLALTGTFEQLLTYVVFAGWIFYGLGALAVFASRRRAPDAVRPFRTPGYPVTPLVFALAAALLVGNTLYSQTRQAAIGLVVVLLGTPVYFLWRSRSRRREGDTAPAFSS
ncbi:MAG TPA: amino acid permease [Gemmatimonadaceae bacterium]|nr:amino acid permease [Gemmatimonadaceae bacterium]